MRERERERERVNEKHWNRTKCERNQKVKKNRIILFGFSDSTFKITL